MATQKKASVGMAKVSPSCARQHRQAKARLNTDVIRASLAMALVTGDALSFVVPEMTAAPSWSLA
jgi:hypothetical protein